MRVKELLELQKRGLKVCLKHKQEYSSSLFGYTCADCYNETLIKIRGG